MTLKYFFIFYFRTAIQDDEMEQTWFDVVWKTTLSQANFQVIFLFPLLFQCWILQTVMYVITLNCYFKTGSYYKIFISKGKTNSNVSIIWSANKTHLIFGELKNRKFSAFRFSADIIFLLDKYYFFVKVKETEQCYIFSYKF